MTAPTRDGVSVVLPLRTSADPAPLLNAWTAYLPKCGRAWELIVVADGVNVPDRDGVTVLRLDTPVGYGMCVRKALSVVQHPLVLLTADGYPYTPADLAKFLEHIDKQGEMPDPATGEWKPRTPDLVAGARAGVPEPGLLRAWGMIIRAFCRIVLDLKLEPKPGWYGFGGHAKAWRAWLAYGVPVHDPHCAFKLVRKALLERFPLQCDGDFFHIELLAKATFLTCMMDEVPLTAKPDAVPAAVWTSADKSVLWGSPKFAHKPEPPAAPSTPPAQPSPEPVA